MKQLTPNKEAIRQHIEFIVSGMNDYEDGRIEIAFGKNSPSSANNFALDEIDQAVECAVKHNMNGCNVYLTGALLDPNSPPFGRASDADFYACNSLWADIDEYVEPKKLRELYNELPPSAIVVTGRHPHIRTHLWWKLDEPITDADALREAVEGAQKALKGDAAVKNPVRIMRIAGSIAWAKKQGRKDEMTEFVIPSNATKQTTIERFLTAYPNDSFVYDSNASDEHKSEIQHTAAVNTLDTRITDGREKYMSDMIYAAIIHLTASLGRWPTVQEVLADTWPEYSKKVSARNPKGLDAEGRGLKAMTGKIKSKLAAFQRGKVFKFPNIEAVINAGTKQQPLPSYTHKEPISFDPETGEVIENEPQDKDIIPRPELIAMPLRNFSPQSLPERKWIYGRHWIRKYSSMTVAAAGTGKSTLAMLDAMSVACGEALVGCDVYEQGNVWIYNLEDPLEEIEKRFAAACIKYGKTYADFEGKLFFNSGRDRELIIMKRCAGHDYAFPDQELLIQAIKANKIDCLIVDPFISSYEGDENSNKDIDKAVKAFNAVADATGCAIELIHHTGKTGVSAGEQNSGRGGSSMVGAVRVLRTLIPMSDAEAATFDIKPEERFQYVRVDGAKANMSKRTDGTQWLYIDGVYLHNGTSNGGQGDSIAVMSVWKQPDMFDNITKNTIIECLYKIDAGIDGDRYSRDSRSREKYVGNIIKTELKVPDKKAKSVAEVWINNGLLFEQQYINKDHKNKMGLFVDMSKIAEM